MSNIIVSVLIASIIVVVGIIVISRMVIISINKEIESKIKEEG